MIPDLALAVQGLHAHDQDVVLPDFHGLGPVDFEGNVAAHVAAQLFAVQPNGGVMLDGTETDEEPLGRFLLVDDEILEVVRDMRVLLVGFHVPDVGEGGLFRLRRFLPVPLIDKARIHGVEAEIPGAVQLYDSGHITP